MSLQSAQKLRVWWCFSDYGWQTIPDSSGGDADSPSRSCCFGRWNSGDRIWWICIHQIRSSLRERVDADQCAGEGKMAAGVVELCTSLRWVCTQHVRWLVTNAGIWVMARTDYNMMHYSLARQFCTLCRLLKLFASCHIAGRHNSQVGNPPTIEHDSVLAISLSISWRIWRKPRIW